jgi:hypothetical protein
MQVETVNMMTKYQLVFVRMETQFAKIFNSNKLRDLRKMQRLFMKFRMFSDYDRLLTRFKSQMMFDKLREGVRGILRIYKLRGPNKI